jgi:hypothetical protein
MLKNMLATGLFEFAFLSIVGILLYGFILLVLDNKLNYNIKDLLKESKDSLIGV